MKNFKILMLGVQEKDNILMGEYKEKEKAIEELKRLKEKDCLHYYEIREEIREEKEEKKKTLINTRINVEDLEKYSKIITKKALKVISCSGSIYAIELLENKDVNTLEDLYQEVALQIILDNYIISKNAFKVVRSYIYKNFEKTEVEIFTDDTEQEREEEKTSYISFMNIEEKKEAKKIDLKKLYSILSDTEKKIFKYYFCNNMKKVDISKMLDIKKQNITTYVNRIKQKAINCI